VVKAWPELELLPKEVIGAMFIKDIKAYQFAADDDRWALGMEDANSFAEHKVHENELLLDDVMRMIPRLVDIAVAWEGCDAGDKDRQLTELGVNVWTLPPASMSTCRTAWHRRA